MIRKFVKGKVIADHLAHHVVKDYEPLNFDLLDENVLTVKDNSEMNG